jgi:hypothetical protein
MFSLWRNPDTGKYSVTLHYVAQTMEQMRNAKAVSLAAPPLRQELSLIGCPRGACSWDPAYQAMLNAVDLAFVERK